LRVFFEQKGKFCPRPKFAFSGSSQALFPRGFAARRLKAVFKCVSGEPSGQPLFLNYYIGRLRLALPPPSASRKQSRTRIALAGRPLT